MTSKSKIRYKNSELRSKIDTYTAILYFNRLSLNLEALQLKIKSIKSKLNTYGSDKLTKCIFFLYLYNCIIFYLFIYFQYWAGTQMLYLYIMRRIFTR